ncbi:MAG: hypothetical protein J6C61_07455 [Clostridia bacterium]|nr:hypothetical protein [Clostridia bacterium]
MKITEETIICELREAHIGNDLRSEELRSKMHEINNSLTTHIEDFVAGLSREQKAKFVDVEDQYSEYCFACEEEAFFYGFKLGQRLAGK